jgi:enamine deaminase RidA (YjgF/YER057c/UK114 family)
MMLERQKVPTGARWAAIVGYSRAVRVGDRVWVSGTTSVGPEGGVAHPGDPYLQTRRCIEIIDAALREVGAGLEHVVRTRLYVKHPEDWQEVGRAHGEAFGEVLPATTMVFTGLIDPDMLVEVEAEAVV